MGVFFSLKTTASEATFVCLLAGRTEAIRRYKLHCPELEDAEINNRLVAYCSDQVSGLKINFFRSRQKSKIKIFRMATRTCIPRQIKLTVAPSDSHLLDQNYRHLEKILSNFGQNQFFFFRLILL